jgi:hypothetical protein
MLLHSVVSEDESSTAAASQLKRKRFMYMTPEQDLELKQKGDTEKALMQTPVPIKAFKIRSFDAKQKSSAGGGFGGRNGNKGSKKTSKNIQTVSEPETSPAISPTVQAILQTIQQDGIVRLDNVMSAKAADHLRDYLVDLKARATQQIEDGSIADSQQRFADVLLNQNRCDLKIPLGPKPVHNALLDVLCDMERGDNNTPPPPSLVRQVIEGAFDFYKGNGKYASLWELNCFMSNSGARRQLVHADNVCLEPVPGLQEEEPILLTCFIALQDIDVTMGPTVWMPGTHTIDAHNRFFETGRDEQSTKTDDYSPKNDILSKSKAVLGAPLPKGACVIFDPRVLHCAGENTCADKDRTRALFYMSFKHPKIDSPGCPSTSGYGISTAELTMEQLVTDLIHDKRGEPARYLGLLASSP